MKCLDLRPAYNDQRINEDLENIRPISNVLVLSFIIIKDWIGRKAASVFLKTEKEWEETEINIHKRKRENEKEKRLPQHSDFASPKVKDQMVLCFADGQPVG